MLFCNTSSIEVLAWTGKTIDDIHCQAFRQDEIRAGRDPDIQSESTIRAMNKILRDSGEWCPSRSEPTTVICVGIVPGGVSSSDSTPSANPGPPRFGRSRNVLEESLDLFL